MSDSEQEPAVAAPGAVVESDIDRFAGQPLTKRVLGFARLTGPGYMQSAMTLGGGSVASCVLLGSLMGYKLLWVQPLGIILGYFVLAAIAKQTCHTEERPYQVFWERLHPSLAIIWAVSALVATLLWHIPQYTLAANGLREFLAGAGASLPTIPEADMPHFLGMPMKTDIYTGLIGLTLLIGAVLIVRLYQKGVSGLRYFELAIKILVWTIVFAFAIVAFSAGIDWRRFFTGITGIAFLLDRFNGVPLPAEAIPPVVGGLAATTGINMLFLYPYTLLKKGWGKKYKELAYFDLLTGLVIPFLFATTFMVLAVANTIGPEEGAVGQGLKDIRSIVPVLAPDLGRFAGSEAAGEKLALLLIGIGMAAVGFSTIITHMLASGFIGCEMFGLRDSEKARWWFSLLPAVGVVGVSIPFPWYASVTASTLAAPLMPVTVFCFLLLLNRPSYMGDELPRGGYRFTWNFMLLASVTIMSFSAYQGLKANWHLIQERLSPAVETTARRMPETKHAGTSTDENREVAFVSHRAMSTNFEFTVYPRPGDADALAVKQLAEEAFSRIDELEQRISTWLSTSQTSAINRRAAAEPVKVAPDVFNLLLACGELHQETGGAFDVTVGPLVALWREAASAGRVPDDKELGAACALTGMDKVMLDEDAGTVRFARSGMRLDFGAVGKGLALDLAAGYLRDNGVQQAMLNAGTSTVIAIGAPDGEDGWQIDLRNPLDATQTATAFASADEASATSACGEHVYSAGAERICHIFDPRTGHPANEHWSATAIADTGTRADALSTAFLVMGPDGVRDFCAVHDGVRAIFISVDEANAVNVMRIPAAA